MKERLTGAIILVAVLVLLVPELLSGPGGGSSTRPAGAESSAPLRSYTIDLANDAAPTSAPTLATDEPVVAATPAPDVADPEGRGTVSADGGFSAAEQGDASTSAGSAVADLRSGEGGQRAPGGGSSAAAIASQSATQNANTDSTKVEGNAARGTPPSAEDDRPRSAFGPNAVQRPKPPAAASSTRAAANAEPSRPATAKVEPPRTAPASAAKPTKGWAVQLGVFASRDNADRLAKQVKGKGYTVSVHETTGNGKRLYRVRVGHLDSRPAAVELGAKLRAAGYPGAVVTVP